MNPDTKTFEPVEEPTPPAKQHWPVFRVGERYTLNGVEFEIRKVTKKDVVLRPVR